MLFEMETLCMKLCERIQKVFKVIHFHCMLFHIEL